MYGSLSLSHTHTVSYTDSKHKYHIYIAVVGMAVTERINLFPTGTISIELYIYANIFIYICMYVCLSL